MNKEFKKISVEMLRYYVPILIRSWRSTCAYVNMLDVNKVTDAFLASQVGITPANFSRLACGVYTISSSVLVAFYVAMFRTIGRNRSIQLRQMCISEVFDKYASKLV